MWLDVRTHEAKLTVQLSQRRSPCHSCNTFCGRAEEKKRGSLIHALFGQTNRSRSGLRSTARAGLVLYFELCTRYTGHVRDSTSLSLINRTSSRAVMQQHDQHKPNLLAFAHCPFHRHRRAGQQRAFLPFRSRRPCEAVYEIHTDRKREAKERKHCTTKTKGRSQKNKQTYTVPV